MIRTALAAAALLAAAGPAPAEAHERSLCFRNATQLPIQAHAGREGAAWSAEVIQPGAMGCLGVGEQGPRGYRVDAQIGGHWVLACPERRTSLMRRGLTVITVSGAPGAFSCGG